MKGWAFPFIRNRRVTFSPPIPPTTEAIHGNPAKYLVRVRFTIDMFTNFEEHAEINET